MHIYALLIPIYNEAGALPQLIKKLQKLKNNIRIIIIDDGSNDETRQILSSTNFIEVISNPHNIGKGASINKALSKVIEKNVILMDGDSEIDIDQIPLLIREYEKNKKEVLLGIRWNHNSKYDLNINSIGNYVINSFFNYLYGSKFCDILCCAKILKSELIKSLEIKSKRFGIEAELMGKLAKLKVDYDEKRVLYNRRSIKDGKKLKPSDGFSIVYTMTKVYFSKIGP